MAALCCLDISKSMKDKRHPIGDIQESRINDGQLEVRLSGRWYAVNLGEPCVLSSIEDFVAVGDQLVKV